MFINYYLTVTAMETNGTYLHLCTFSQYLITFEITSYLQYNFIRSGGVQLALNMLTKNNFLPNADLPTRR